MNSEQKIGCPKCLAPHQGCPGKIALSYQSVDCECVGGVPAYIHGPPEKKDNSFLKLSIPNIQIDPATPQFETDIRHSDEELFQSIGWEKATSSDLQKIVDFWKGKMQNYQGLKQSFSGGIRFDFIRDFGLPNVITRDNVHWETADHKNFVDGLAIINIKTRQRSYAMGGCIDRSESF